MAKFLGSRITVSLAKVHTTKQGSDDPNLCILHIFKGSNEELFHDVPKVCSYQIHMNMSVIITAGKRRKIKAVQLLHQAESNNKLLYTYISEIT